MTGAWETWGLYKRFIVPGMCSTDEIQWNEGKIDFYPYNFLFPEGSQRVNMEVEGQKEIKEFCIDFVQVWRNVIIKSREKRYYPRSDAIVVY